jgi:hypothetical protein
MSYICTGREVSTDPVICHCHVVPGPGCQTPPAAEAVGVGSGAGLTDGDADALGDGDAVGVAVGLADEPGSATGGRVSWVPAASTWWVTALPPEPAATTWTRRSTYRS